MDFTKNIIDWYTSNKRDLPWRKTTNPYFIWLSEIILQQTQVKQGLPYYHSFVTNFPTVFDLAKASEEEVLKLWQGLGYYSRARNLHTTAKIIATEYNGKFPETYKELLQLKGVGDYTASAIASFAFKKVEAVVDGNVYRVLSRFYGIDTPINTTTGIKEFKALATSLIDPNVPGTFNQAIMEFGATQCKPKNPYCLHCPLNSACSAYQNNTIETLPVKLKKTKITKKYFNYLVCIDTNKHIVLEKRTGKGIWQNLYQFPLLESQQSLSSDEFNTLDLDSSVLKGLTFSYALYNLKDKIHKLSHQHLYTKFWIIEVDALLPNAIPLTKLDQFPVPVLIGDFIAAFNFKAV